MCFLPILSATNTLQQDHIQARRIEKLASKASQVLYTGGNVPFSDIQKMIVIMAEFFDSIHYSREEDSYFACVAGYNRLQDEVRVFMIEHEFGRRIANKIKFHLEEWQNGKDSREPVARFLRTYSIYLMDHLQKEDKFFQEASSTVLNKDEEVEMYNLFHSSDTINMKISEIIKEIDNLENRSWYTQSL